MRVDNSYMLVSEAGDPATARIVTDYKTEKVSRLITPKPIAIVWHVDFNPTSGKVDPGPIFKKKHLSRILDEVFV